MRTIFSILLLFMVNSLFADFTTTPYFLTLSDLEMKYALQNNHYTVEKREDLSSDTQGIAYFFPRFLESSTISYSSRLVNESVDAFIFATKTPDLCKNNIETIYSADGSKLITLKNSDGIGYFSYRSLIRVDFTDDIEHQNFWFYLYPKIKRDHIVKVGTSYRLYAFPVVANFSFQFNKTKVDNFVKQYNINIQKCNNTLTYLDKKGFDYLINQLLKEGFFNQNNGIEPKYALDFSDFQTLEQYTKTIKERADESENQTFQRYATLLFYKSESAKTRIMETQNLCHYLNYIMQTPEYTQGLRDQLTITNSCPVKGTIDQLNNYIRLYITGYKISGVFKSLNNKQYIVKKDGSTYEFTQEDGCDIQKHSIEDPYLLQRIQNRPSEGYYIDLYDWDNDANKRFDCLKIRNNIAYKVYDFNTTSNQFLLKAIQYPIEKIGDEIAIFNKSTTIDINSSTSNEIAIGSSSQNSSSQTYSSSTSASSNSKNSQTDDIMFPGEENTNQKSSSEHFQSSIPVSYSSSNSSSKSSQISTTNNIENNIVGKTLPIDGFFIHYGQGDFDWIYITKKQGTVLKLNGLKPDGKFDWTKLSNIKCDRQQNDTFYCYEK